MVQVVAEQVVTEQILAGQRLGGIRLQQRQEDIPRIFRQMDEILPGQLRAGFRQAFPEGVILASVSFSAWPGST